MDYHKLVERVRSEFSRTKHDWFAHDVDASAGRSPLGAGRQGVSPRDQCAGRLDVPPLDAFRDRCTRGYLSATTCGRLQNCRVAGRSLHQRLIDGGVERSPRGLRYDAEGLRYHVTSVSLRGL